MENYVIRGGRLGAERLQVLARSWAPTTLALFDRAGVGPGQSCLDLGCGGGDVTLEMARLVGPGGRVTGVDMDEVKLDIARERAAELGLGPITFVPMNVYDWSDPGAHDLVYCRNVLQHLSRPVDVLRGMWDGVRPGGVLVVEDADFEGSFCYPPNDGFDFCVTRYMRVLEKHGGDPLSGRKLAARFAEAGIGVPELTVVQRADLAGEAKSLPFSTVDATGEAMVAEGVATEAELAAALASLAVLADDGTTLFGSPRVFQAWVRKPVA
jgi:SAM-dependent methyltransferase